MSSKDFVVVAKRGTVFNLTDCGIPLDVTDHKTVNLSATSTELEREKSMQLRAALHDGHLIHVEDKHPIELPKAPEPIFTIPEHKVTIDGGGKLSASTHIQKITQKHAPESYAITGDVSDEVRDSIANGIAANKATDFAEQQRILAGESEQEEAEIEQVLRTGKKSIPELMPGTVDGHPAGYEFKAPQSPALAEANAGMGNETDPLSESAAPKSKKQSKGSKKKTQPAAE
jgi:hypothetical protein